MTKSTARTKASTTKSKDSAGTKPKELEREKTPAHARKPAKAIDTLDILDLNDDETRTYERGEGPRGLRNEVLSGRWKAATTTVHKIMVEYDEES